MVKLASDTTALFVLSLAALTQAQKQPADSTQSQAACSKDITGTGQGDLDIIKTCKQFTGNILVDNSPVDQLTLDGVEEMTGDLIIKSSDALRSFSAPKLKKVGGQLSIIDNTKLEKLDMPALTEAKSLTLSVLPVLEQIQFPSGLSKVEDMRIEDTRAPSIDGLQMETLNSFTLAQNNYMKKFDLSVKELKGKLYVAGNGHEMNFEAKKLTSLQSATFRDLAEVHLPALAHVTSDISFHQNEFSSLALDNVEDIGGTLTIANNDHLTETSFKALNLIGGALSVGNNTQLASLGGYPKLNAVHGTVDLAGNFDSYEFPVLQDIRGGMRVQTTSTQFPCPEVEKKLKMTSVVKGNVWSCKSGMDASKMEPTIGQGSGGGSAPSMDKSGKPSNDKSSQANSGAAGLTGSLSLILAGITFALGF